MASSGKKKTTMAKMNRENRQREKRQEKEARKNARKSGLDLPDESAATDETTEDAWQLTRGLSEIEAG